MKGVNKFFEKRTFDFGILSSQRDKIMGAATIMIVVFHFAQMSNCFSGVLYTIVMTLCSGVEIFILMTGIGLYYSFQKNNNVKQFYIKRIYNVYFIYLVISLPYIIWWSLVNKESALLPLNWLFPNYIFGCARDVWYIPFIMVMYLIYPVIYKFLFSDKIYKYRYFIVLAFSAIWYTAYYLLLKSGNEYFNKIEIGIFRFPIFLVSCLIGEVVYKKRKVSKTVIPAAIVLSFLAMLISFKVISGQFGLRAMNALAGIIYLIIMALFFNFVKIDFINKILAFFSKMSLELYLVHLLIFKVLAYYGIDNWMYYLVSAILSVIISYPLSKLRGKFVEHSKKIIIKQTAVL